MTSHFVVLSEIYTYSHFWCTHCAVLALLPTKMSLIKSLACCDAHQLNSTKSKGGNSSSSTNCSPNRKSVFKCIFRLQYEKNPTGLRDELCFAIKSPFCQIEFLFIFLMNATSLNDVCLCSDDLTLWSQSACRLNECLYCRRLSAFQRVHVLVRMGGFVRDWPLKYQISALSLIQSTSVPAFREVVGVMELVWKSRARIES